MQPPPPQKPEPDTTTTTTSSQYHILSDSRPTDCNNYNRNSSSYSNNDLPKVVLDMKWNQNTSTSTNTNTNANSNDDSIDDCYYTFIDDNSSNNESVIGIFDIDRTIYAESDNRKQTIWSWIICFLFIFAILFGWIVIILIMIVLVLYFVYYLPVLDDTEIIYRVQRQHIAITRSAIYIDMVDPPGSTNMVQRKIIPFHTIQSCIVQSQFISILNTMRYYIHVEYVVDVPVTATATAPHQQQQTTRTISNNEIIDIHGIRDPQNFVTIINAMIQYNNNKINSNNNNEQQQYKQQQ